MVDSINNYMKMLHDNGFVVTNSGNYVIYYYYQRGANRLMIFVDMDDCHVSVNVYE